MAGFLSLYAKTERIIIDTPDPDTEYWVDVKISINKADADAAQRKLMKNKIDMSGGTSNINGDLDIPSYEEEMVVKSLVAWNLTDDNGQILPLAPEPFARRSVQQLPSVVVSQIFNKVQDLNGRRTSKDSDSFRDQPNGGREAGEDN